jgi:pyrroline-5-carboxylate reductase
MNKLKNKMNLTKSNSFSTTTHKESVRKTIGIIGCGNLGKSILESAIHSGMRATNLRGSVNSPSKVDILQKKYDIKIYPSNQNYELVNNSDYVVISVKPGQVKNVLVNIYNYLTKDTIIISTAAGVTLDHIRKYVNINQPIIRCMPNLAVSSGDGVVGVYSDNMTYHETNIIMKKMFRDSYILHVDREDKMDAVTAISGCGPAYLAYLTKHIYMTGRLLGLSLDESYAITKKTLVGTGILLDHNTFEQIMYKVASKGGATEAGLKSMEESNCGISVSKGINEAHKRIRKIKADLE